MDTLDRQVDGFFLALRVEFLLITESGYLRDDLVFFSEVLGGGVWCTRTPHRSIDSIFEPFIL